MVNIKINGIEYAVEEGTTILKPVVRTASEFYSLLVKGYKRNRCVPYLRG